MENKNYAVYYNDKAFWEKMKLEGRTAGKSLCKKAFILYYLVTDGRLSEASRQVAVHALGYFIAEEDVIPDFVPAVGYNDDMDVLMEAEKKLAEYITWDTLAKSEQAIRGLFP